MAAESVQRTFTAALDALIVEIKTDRSILAAILCGSLSHDTVWAKSDIDLVLVTADDKGFDKADSGRALYADGVNVHAMLMSRSDFRKVVEGSIGHSFGHSFLAKGRLLYTHDPTIADLCTRLAAIGSRDTGIQILRAATHALGPLYKAHKWLITRRDFDYTAVWLLYTATPIAQIEVISHGLLVDREVLPQASALNPELLATIYHDLLNRPTPAAVRKALDTIDRYLRSRADWLFAPVLAYLSDAGDARPASEIDDHFARHWDVHAASMACEYLADQGLLGKASTPARLTKRSTVVVQELAFFHPGTAER